MQCIKMKVFIHIHDAYSLKVNKKEFEIEIHLTGWANTAYSLICKRIHPMRTKKAANKKEISNLKRYMSYNFLIYCKQKHIYYTQLKWLA